MTRWSKVGLVVAALFSLANLLGVLYHAALGELLWTGVHAGLALLGAHFVRKLAHRHRAPRIWRRGESEIPAQAGELNDRLTHIEQSVDAVAMEVERIGEGQRFITRVFTEKGTSQAPGQGAAEPIEVKAGGAAPHVRHS